MPLAAEWRHVRRIRIVLKSIRVALCAWIVWSGDIGASRAQTGSERGEVLAVYRALIRGPVLGTTGFSADSVTIHPETHLFAIYVSARLLSWDAWLALPEEFQTALLAAREPGESAARTRR
jgi:hypothetical protein